MFQSDQQPVDIWMLDAQSGWVEQMAGSLSPVTDSMAEAWQLFWNAVPSQPEQPGDPSA